MRLLETSEILNLVEYEKVREARRRELIELKRPRRVPVGRYLSFVFENRETPDGRHQICDTPGVPLEVPALPERWLRARAWSLVTA